jgi:hypothetical protein
MGNGYDIRNDLIPDFLLDAFRASMSKWTSLVDNVNTARTWVSTFTFSYCKIADLLSLADGLQAATIIFFRRSWISVCAVECSRRRNFGLMYGGSTVGGYFTNTFYS